MYLPIFERFRRARLDAPIGSSMSGIARIATHVWRLTIVGATASVPAVAQRSAATAVVAGVVRDSAHAVPLPFSVVTVTSATPQEQRFTSESGRFELTNLHAGPVTLRVRHLGFAPRDVRLTLEAGERREIVVDLAAVFVTLPVVAVQASRTCIDPGAPRASADSAFAAVFDQLRQNADQFRLLATSYPFISSLDRTFVAELHDGSFETERRDTIVMRSDRFWPYHPGQVITRSTDVRSGSDYVMHIPTLDVVTDSLFLNGHCFTNGGRVDVDGLPRLRIDFQSAASIAGPDVDGSMYLDPVTFQIRRSVVRLSRRPRQFPQVDSLDVTTDFDEVYPSLPIITAIRSRTRLYTPRQPTAARATIEQQQLLALSFRGVRPGQSAAPAVASPIRKPPRTVAVVDSANGLALANVELHDPVSDSSAYTDVNGRATLGFLADSGGLVTIRRIGYAMRVVRLSARSGDAAAARIAMSRAVTLPAVVAEDSARQYISPSLNAFEERRRLRTGGYFIGDSTLRKEENRKLGDVMRSHIPGVMLAEGAHLANYLLKSPRCASGGPPQVYLDGVPLTAPPISAEPHGQPLRPTTSRDQAAAFPPFDLTQFSVSDLAGVEYYPDGTTLPVEFSPTSNRCGALLLWTREK
jgi:Carboxypeptidase regulatory-like domain